MRAADVTDAEAAWDDAYRTLLVEIHLPTSPRTPDFVSQRQRRMAHLLATDPDGSWVATSSGAIVGVAQSHRRGDRWVLATLGVRPDRQERGVGRELLERTLDYGRSAPIGAIFSSPDPRAVHRYARAGFDLHPTVVAFGPARVPGPESPSVRQGSRRDLAVVEAVDRVVRGGPRTLDIEFQMAQGAHLLLAEDAGYLVGRGGTVFGVAALDDRAAARLLAAAVVRCPDGEPVNVSWITARQQWAVRTLVAAGVPLFVHEAVMTRGPWEPELPYLASGIFG